MATSGSANFSVTRDDIITEALEILGVLGEGQAPNADQLSSSARTLNMMVKGWQNRVKHLHVIQDIFLFQDGVKTEYTLDGSTDHATTDYAATTTSAAASSGASSITVTSITGFADGDFVGIELDDGTRQWTTINGSPSGSTIALDATLTDDVSSGATVFGYTTKVEKPMRIDVVYTRDLSSPTNPIDTPVRSLARRDYVDLSNKTATGRVNQVYIDYQRTQTKITTWPLTDTVDSVIGMKAWRTLEDFDAANDDADFPQSWYHALAVNLAVYLAPKYGYPTQERMTLKQEAEILLMDAESQESEEYFRIVPDDRNW